MIYGKIVRDYEGEINVRVVKKGKTKNNGEK